MVFDLLGVLVVSLTHCSLDALWDSQTSVSKTLFGLVREQEWILVQVILLPKVLVISSRDVFH